MIFVDAGEVDYQHPDNQISLLHIAAEMSCPEAIEQLLSNGANAYIRDKFGHTPMHFAVDADLGEVTQPDGEILWEVVDVFAKFDLNWHIPTYGGETPVHWAEQYGHRVKLELLKRIRQSEVCGLSRFAVRERYLYRRE